MPTTLDGPAPAAAPAPPVRELDVDLCRGLLMLRAPGGGPTPPDLAAALRPELRYTFRWFERGSREPYSGGANPHKSEVRDLHSFDRGYLACPWGFRERILGRATELGFAPRVVEFDPPGKPAGCYDEDWESVLARFEFRPRQEEGLAAIAGNRGGLFYAVPAFGKTKLFEFLGWLYPNARILITTKSSGLVDKTHKALTAGRPSVGLITGGTNRPGRITVCTADSLHKVDPSEVDILLADEAHELMAPKYLGLLYTFMPYARMYAFTGSPDGRADGGDAHYEPVFGPRIFSIGQREAEALGSVVPVTVIWHSVDMVPNPAAGKKDAYKMRAAYWRNLERNRKIAEVARLYSDDEQVLILVSTTEHAIQLGAALPEFALVYADIAPLDLAAAKKSRLLPEDYDQPSVRELHAMRGAFESRDLKKAIATDVWMRGVSFDTLSVLIRADGRGSKNLSIQGPGRVTRTHAASAKLSSTLHDFTDRFDEGCLRASKSRRAMYDEQGWKNVDAPSTWRPDR